MPDNLTQSHHDPLDTVIADYIQQVETGSVPDREVLLADHPELAERLRAFFADYDRLDRQAAELHLSHGTHHTADWPEPTIDLPRVRYFGDYELLEVIARGGMGVVYKARQVSLNRVVALKMILAGELATKRDVSAVSGRSRSGRQPRSSANRADLRDRRARGPAIFLDEVCRRQFALELAPGERSQRGGAVHRHRPSRPFRS